MRTHLRHAQQYVVALALLLACLQASADTLTGKVVKVADGDTLTVRTGQEQHRICLAGIDSPASAASSRLHLSDHPLHNADADADVAGNGPNPRSGLPGCAYCFLLGRGHRRPAQAFPAGFRAAQARPDALLNHGPLELGEHTAHLEHCLAGGRRRVNALLVQVQIYARRVQLIEESDKVLQGATQAIDRPCHHDVELSADARLEKGVELRSLLAALGAADAVVDVLGRHHPPPALGHGTQLKELVLGGLAVGGDAGVDRRAPC